MMFDFIITVTLLIRTPQQEVVEIKINQQRADVLDSYLSSNNLVIFFLIYNNYLFVYRITNRYLALSS